MGGPGRPIFAVQMRGPVEGRWSKITQIWCKIRFCVRQILRGRGLRGKLPKNLVLYLCL